MIIRQDKSIKFGYLQAMSNVFSTRFMYSVSKDLQEYIMRLGATYYFK